MARFSRTSWDTADETRAKTPSSLGSERARGSLQLVQSLVHAVLAASQLIRDQPDADRDEEKNGEGDENRQARHEITESGKGLKS